MTAWFAAHPAATNVGIRTGAGLIALDIDDGGEESLAALEAEQGSLPLTPTVTTGSGGRHIYLRAPRDLRSRNLRAAGIDGLELAAAGRVLAAPPSIHPTTGREYAWTVPLVGADLAQAPPWLVDLAGEQRPARVSGAIDQGDPLRSIPATVYVPALLGVELGRDHKALCPFHAEEEPSLHAYDGSRGWFCFGCGRGGSIVDLGAHLWGVEPRGRGYHELRRRLAAELLARASMTAPLTPEQHAALQAIAASNGVPDPAAAMRELTALLGLGSVGLAVVGGRIVGRGSTASADLYLSNGEAITFESLRDFANASRLAVEVAACTGAVPAIKAPTALHALSLLRALSELHETATEDDVSRAWGCEYLQGARRLAVDMNDQGDRWRAFSELAAIDPATDARHGGGPSVRAHAVLADVTGARLVRCGWFLNYARESTYVAPRELSARMQRVGWRRRGSRGWIKATAPGRSDTLAWTFYVAPAGWEGDDTE